MKTVTKTPPRPPLCATNNTGIVTGLSIPTHPVPHTHRLATKNNTKLGEMLKPFKRFTVRVFLLGRTNSVCSSMCDVTAIWKTVTSPQSPVSNVGSRFQLCFLRRTKTVPFSLPSTFICLYHPSLIFLISWFSNTTNCCRREDTS